VAGFGTIFTLDVVAILAGLQSGAHHPQVLAVVHLLSAGNVVLFALLLARVRQAST